MNKGVFTFLDFLPNEIKDLILSKTDIYSALNFDLSEHVERKLVQEDYHLNVRRVRDFNEKCQHTVDDKKKFCDTHTRWYPEEKCNCEVFCCNKETVKNILTDDQKYDLLYLIRKYKDVQVENHYFKIPNIRGKYEKNIGMPFEHTNYIMNDPFNKKVKEIFDISDVDMHAMIAERWSSDNASIFQILRNGYHAHSFNIKLCLKRKAVT